jgi:hypothetical protein
MVKIKGYPILNNVSFLYFIFVLFIFNLGIFVYIKDNQSIFLIACSSLIVYLFNNNMIMVMLISMLIVNSLVVINILTNKTNNTKEGIENATDTPSETTTTTTSDTATTETGTPPAANPGTDYSTPSNPGNTTITDCNKENAELIKKINTAISAVKSSADNLQKIDPELDIDLKDLNNKLNDLFAVAD